MSYPRSFNACIALLPVSAGSFAALASSLKSQTEAYVHEVSPIPGRPSKLILQRRLSIKSELIAFSLQPYTRFAMAFRWGFSTFSRAFKDRFGLTSPTNHKPSLRALGDVALSKVLHTLIRLKSRAEALTGKRISARAPSTLFCDWQSLNTLVIAGFVRAGRNCRQQIKDLLSHDQPSLFSSFV
jgi:hypothetical protein